MPSCADDETRPEARAGFEKAIVAGVVDAVVPFQAVLERLAADVARANKCRAMKVAIIIEVGEQVSLHVKAAARRLEHAHLRALLRSNISNRSAADR